MFFIFLILFSTVVSTELDSLHFELARIDKSIKALAPLNSPPILEKKYTLKFQNASRVSVVQAIKAPSKKDISYPLLLLVDNTIYNVAGEELIRLAEQPFLVASYRNQFTFFYQGTQVKQLETQGKQILLNSLFSVNQTGITSFASSMVRGKRVFAFGTQQGKILIYSKNGEVQKVFDVSNSPILQIQRASTILYYRSKTRLGSLALFDRRITQCQQPSDQILDIKILIQQNSLMYAVTKHRIYMYQGPQCKPRGFIPVGAQCQIEILNNLLLCQLKRATIIYNSSHNHQQSVMMLHSTPYTIQAFKKSDGVYGLSTIINTSSQSSHNTQIHFYNYVVMDVNTTSFSLKGFKAPIFIISIAIVFYYSMRMRNKDTKSQVVPQQNLLQQGEQAPSLEQRIQRAEMRMGAQLGQHLTKQQFQRLVKQTRKASKK